MVHNDPLPAGESEDSAKSFEGKPFNPFADTWNLRDTATEYDIEWGRLKPLVTSRFLRNAKTTLRWYVENRSVSRARNLYLGLLSLIEGLDPSNSKPLSLLTESQLIRWRTLLGKRREYRLGSLSGFLLRGYEQGHPCIDAGAARWLEEVKLRGNAKGEAVATQDPVTGPLTQVESLAVFQSTTAAVGDGRISLDDFCLVQLQSALGSRSVQFAALKCKDLRPPKDPTTDDWILMVPRAKQRLERARSELKPRSLIPELAQIVSSLVEYVQSTYRSSDQSVIPIDELPIFPNWDAPDLTGFEFHSTGQELGKRLTTMAKELDIRSERTGKRLNLTSRRFRYTVGTRAAEEGHGELVIAELLDHSDIQQVGVYVRSTQKIAERISKALAFQLAPLAQAFMGMLIETEAEATRGDDPSSRIRDPDKFEVLGNCGKMGVCSEAAPIACYTCRRFQAWVDGPHEQLLDALLIRRERVHSATGDLRIASVNDRTILAVANVVQLCRRRREPRLQ